MSINAIVTMPPYAPYLSEVIRHPIVSGIRLNTVMPVKDSLEEVLKRMNGQADGKDLWVDLKCRQLRIVGYWVPPFTEVQLSHRISVNTPVTAIFSDKHYATVVAVDGNRLITQEGPKRVVGPGEAVNIPDPSLSIDGFFTDTDLKYIEAGQNARVAKYMLSFVEGKADIGLFRQLYPEAEVIAKIESRKGVAYVQKEWNNDARLMAARGDLYIEVEKPHQVVRACRDIISRDENAIVASRIFESLAYSYEPSCEDIGDVDSLMQMGYKTFMFGDQICMRRETILNGLNLLMAMADSYEGMR